MRYTPMGTEHATSTRYRPHTGALCCFGNGIRCRRRPAQAGRCGRCRLRCLARTVGHGFVRGAAGALGASAAGWIIWWIQQH